MASESRAERIIASLTEAEKNYFIACTDIFHDAPYSVIGRPSLSTQMQNTVVINLEKTISRNDFGIGNVDWDVNVMSFPFLTSQRLITTVDNGSFLTLPAVTSASRFGGVTAFATTGGDTLLPNGPSLSLNCDKFFFPEFVGSLTEHNPRVYYEVLSMGMEIINTTPALTRGGSVTRYRVPTQGRTAQFALINSGGVPKNLTDTRPTLYSYPLPPVSEAFAAQYPDSVLDSAEQGSYQMHTIQDQVSDYYVSGNGQLTFTNTVPPASAGSFNTYSSESLWLLQQALDPPLIRGDFDIVGSYFTGLSPTTTLKIRSRYLVSMVPMSSQASLVSLAKISPDYNPDLDTLISLLQADFPPGIASSMNASGDWWKIVLRGIAKVAGPVGGLIGGSTGRTIGSGVGAVAGLLAGKAPAKKNAAPQAPPVPNVLKVPRPIGPSRIAPKVAPRAKAKAQKRIV